MRVSDGVIYLAQPLFGRSKLTGSFVVLTSVIDFTFSEPLTITEADLGETAASLTSVRVLIPFANVIGVLIEHEAAAGIGPH